jgi:hypothetical protein
MVGELELTADRRGNFPPVIDDFMGSLTMTIYGSAPTEVQQVGGVTA